jgi:hypothetical protein
MYDASAEDKGDHMSDLLRSCQTLDGHCRDERRFVFICVGEACEHARIRSARSDHVYANCVDPTKDHAIAASIRASAAFAVAFTASRFPRMPAVEYAPSINMSN